MKYIWGPAVMLPLLFSCEYISMLPENGNADTLAIRIAPQAVLTIDAPCHLLLVSDTTAVQSVTGPDFIIEDYRLTNSTNGLTIGHAKPDLINKDKMGTVTLCASALSAITVNAPCIIETIDTLKSPTISMVVNGGGTYTESRLTMNSDNFNLTVYGGINQTQHLLAGRTKKSNFFIEGYTAVDAAKLTSEVCKLTQRSCADCTIGPSLQLEAVIYSTGSIFYYGTPQINYSRVDNAVMSASGQLKKMQ